MRYTIKNVTYQPLHLIVCKDQILLHARKSITISKKDMNDQIVNLKTRGLVKITKR